MMGSGAVASATTAGPSASAEEDEALETLQALLDLLVHMTEWDMLDVAGEGGGRKFDVGAVSFMGLSLILKLVTPTALEVPSVSQQFFGLLLHLVEVYPDRLSGLDPQLFGVILQAIVYALDNACLEVCKCGFRAVTAMALYHYGTQCRSPLGRSDFFPRMCSKVLRMCIDCYFDSSLLMSVGAACWALFCVLQDQAQPLMQACVADHPQAYRIAVAFQQLVTANDVRFNNTCRQHKTSFNNNFEVFVAIMRALRMK